MGSALEVKLRHYLNLYWLRPENGLLCAFKSKAFEDLEIEAPSVDISCGDGLFMFVHLGGVCGDDFDYFVCTRAGEFSHRSFVDIYDSCPGNYEVPIVQRPAVTIDYGTDFKQALLDKAGRLDLYGELVLHDNNLVPLPLPEHHFQTVYSNAVYWTENVEPLLADIHRMLKPGGRALLEVMTPYFLETLDDIEPYLSAEAMVILDRRRRQTMPGSRHFGQWRAIMESCGFAVQDCRCVYPARVLLDIWNIGLRPISHLLIQMTDAVSAEQRSKIKREWVDIFFELFKPLLSARPTYTLERAPYLLFVLTK